MTEYYGSGLFCSRYCSYSRKHTEETKEKISNSRKKKINKQYKCIVCDKTFTANRFRKTCSDKCLNLYRTHKFNKTEYQLYRQQCSFRFNLNDYADFIDLTLLKQYGMYKILRKNESNNNNINGVSRDHMYSISDGYKNHIDPYFISHPVNCSIIKQLQNASKNAKSIITLDELKTRIKDFDKKYGKYENKIDYFNLESFRR